MASRGSDLNNAEVIERLDRIAAALAELRSELAGAEAGEAETLHHGDAKSPDDADDLAAEHLIDTSSASARFNYPRDTIASWARQTAGTEQAIAIRSGGRWLIDPKRLRARLNGKVEQP